MDQPVLIDRRESWLKLTLNRPDRLNAFNAAQHTALAAALDDAAKDPEIRAVLLTHGHLDHAGGAVRLAPGQPVQRRLLAAWNCPR